MKSLFVIFFINVSLVHSLPVDNVNEFINYGVIKGDTNSMEKQKINVSAVFEDIKKLKSKKSQDEIRRIATVGILAGAIKVEQSMNDHLAALTRDLFKNYNASTPEDNMEKLFNLEQTMERDRRAIEILGSALDFAIHSKSYEEYKEDVEAIGRSSEISMLELAKKKFSTQMTSNKTSKGEKVGKSLKQSNDLRAELTKRMQDVRSSVNKHIYTVHSMLRSKEKKTINYLKTASSTPKPTTKPAVDFGLLKNFIQPKGTTQYDTTTDATTDYTEGGNYETFPPSEKESRLAGLLNRLKRQDGNSEVIGMNWF